MKILTKEIFLYALILLGGLYIDCISKFIGVLLVGLSSYFLGEIHTKKNFTKNKLDGGKK